MAFGGCGDRDLVSSINVTPLCDIFVVLLIIFMVTATDANQQGPAIDLPQTAEASSSPPKPEGCTVTVTEDLGSVYVDGTATTLEDLPARLTDAIGRAAGKKVMVRTDPRVPLERVVKVMGVARACGAEGIGLGTRVRGS